MWFETYRHLSHKERALLDGRLITYHFYVGGATLLVLGIIGVSRDDFFPWVAVVFGVASLAMGVGLHLFHRKMVSGPRRTEYLATVSAALGRHRFPLMPSLLGILTVFSVFVTVLYLLAG